MDLVRAFSATRVVAHGVAINIQGIYEEPLFQAKQISELLGFANIRETLRDFDADEKAVISTDTLGGRQDVVFLTEVGLYRLLGMSRKFGNKIKRLEWDVEANTGMRGCEKYRGRGKAKYRFNVREMVSEMVAKRWLSAHEV